MQVHQIKILGETTILDSNRPFKSSSEFKQISTSTGIGFTITDSNKTTVLATSAKYKIDKGNAYTIIAKGLKYGSETSKLTIGMIKNDD